MTAPGKCCVGNASEKGHQSLAQSFLDFRGGGIERHCGILCKGMSSDKRQEIIGAYLSKLERIGSTLAVESDLPYEKELIRLAILEELAENPNSEFRNHLEIAYVQLEGFIPYEQFRVIADFKNASLAALQMADTGDPAGILNSARIMKKVEGDRAVNIQEEISDKMKKRLAQLREMCDRECAGSIPDYSWGVCC